MGVLDEALDALTGDKNRRERQRQAANIRRTSHGGTPTVPIQSGFEGGSVRVNNTATDPVNIDGPVDVANSTGEIDANNTSSVTSVGAGSSYQGTYTDMLGKSAMEIAVYSTEVGQAKVHFSLDGVTDTHTHTYTTTASRLFWRREPRMTRYMRIQWVNNGAGSTTPNIQSILAPIGAAPSIGHVDDTMTDSNIASVVRSVLAGRTAGGVYGNIPVDSSFRLQIDNAAFSADVPIEALSTWAHGQTAFTNTAGGTILIPSPITGRKSFVIKALSTNTKLVYIGKSGLTASTGFELAAGESVTLDLDETESVYGIAETAASQSVSWIEVAT